MKKRQADGLEESIDVQLEKLDLQTGDVVLMRFSFPLQPEIVKGLTAKLYDSMPPGVRVLVVDPSVEVTIHHLGEAKPATEVDPSPLS